MFDFPWKESQKVTCPKKKKSVMLYTHDRVGFWRVPFVYISTNSRFLSRAFSTMCDITTPKSKTTAQERCISFSVVIVPWCAKFSCLLQRKWLTRFGLVPSARAAPVYGHTSLGQHSLRDLCAVQTYPSYDPVLILRKQH